MNQDRTNTRPTVHQAADELLRRASAPASQPHRLIAAGVKRGRGPLRIRGAVTA